MTQRNLQAQPGFIVIDGQAGRAYNEAAFRYFLDVERKRAEHARRQLLLVLINRRGTIMARPPLGKSTGPAVLDALTECTREVDVVGWYRDGYIAGALLHTAGIAEPATRQVLFARVMAALQQRLTSDIARLQVRVIGVGGKSRR